MMNSNKISTTHSSVHYVTYFVTVHHGMGMKAPFPFWRGGREEDSADPTVLFVAHLTGTGVPVILLSSTREAGVQGAAMQTVPIYRLKDLDQRPRCRLRPPHLEAPPF